MLRRRSATNLTFVLASVQGVFDGVGGILFHETLNINLRYQLRKVCPTATPDALPRCEVSHADPPYARRVSGVSVGPTF